MVKLVPASCAPTAPAPPIANTNANIKPAAIFAILLSTAYLQALSLRVIDRPIASRVAMYNVGEHCKVSPSFVENLRTTFLQSNLAWFKLVTARTS